MSNANASASIVANDNLQLTPEIIHAVLAAVQLAHFECTYDHEDIERHLATGGRDIAATQYVMRALQQGVSHERVIDLYKLHVRNMSLGRSLTTANRLSIAKLSGLLQLAESGDVDMHRDEDRSALMDEAQEVAEECSLPELSSWCSLIKGVCCMRWAGPSLDLGSDMLDAASECALEITQDLYKRDPALAERFVSELRALSGLKEPALEALRSAAAH